MEKMMMPAYYNVLSTEEMTYPAYLQKLGCPLHPATA